MKKGILNPNYQEIMIYRNLEDDMAKINKVFEIFNEAFFENELDTPVIIVGPNLKKDYRVDRPGKWRKKKGTKVDDELIKMVIAERVFGRETKEIYVILLTAMIMQYDLEKEVEYEAKGGKWKHLINNNGHYFSKRYYLMCKQMGLEVKHTKNGKEEVVSGKKFDEFYEYAGIEDNFKLTYKYKEDNTDDKDNKNNKKKNNQSMRAFICPACGMIIRITKNGDVDIRCYNHNKKGVPCNGARFVEKEEKK